MRASLRRWLSAASFLAIAGTSGFVAAQSPKDIAAAKQAFKEGDEAERRGDFETALARYEAAIKVKETPQLYLRIGAAKEKLGRLVAALASYRQGLEKAAGQPLVVKVAEEQIAALEPKIPTLTLVAPSALPGFKATLDGEPVAADKLGQPLPLDPGKHKVHAEADGLPARDEELDLGEGRRVRLELDLKPADGPAAPAEGSSKVPAIVALGAGGAAVVAGLAVFIVSYTKDATINDECGGSERLRCPLSKKATIESQVSSANTFRVAGAVTGLVGLAGVGTGIALLLRAAPPPVTTGLVRVEPAVGPGFAGLGVSGRF